MQDHFVALVGWTSLKSQMIVMHQESWFLVEGIEFWHRKKEVHLCGYRSRVRQMPLGSKYHNDSYETSNLESVSHSNHHPFCLVTIRLIKKSPPLWPNWMMGPNVCPASSSVESPLRPDIGMKPTGDGRSSAKKNEPRISRNGKFMEGYWGNSASHLWLPESTC